MSLQKDTIIDKRVLQRHLLRGNISRDDFQTHLNALEDQQENAEDIWPIIMDGTQSEMSRAASEEEIEDPPPPASIPTNDEEASDSGVPAAVDFGG